MTAYYTYIYFVNGTPEYVGKGKGDRWSEHYFCIRGNHWQNHLQKAKREGLDIRVVIGNVTRDEQAALDAESLLIASYGRRDLGTGSLFNLTDGGEGGSTGRVWKPETLAKISASQRGRKHPNRPPVSEEARAAMSRALKVKPRSPKQLANTAARHALKLALNAQLP